MELEEARKIYETLVSYYPKKVGYNTLTGENYKVILNALDVFYKKDVEIYLENHVIHVRWRELWIETRAGEEVLRMELKRKAQVWVYPLSSDELRVKII